MNYEELQDALDRHALFNIPPGIHEIDQTLVISQSCIEFRGIGTGGFWYNNQAFMGPAMIRWAGEAGGTMIRIDSPEGCIGGVKISGLGLDCNNKARAMDLRSLVRCTIEDIMIVGVPLDVSEAIYFGISEEGFPSDCHGTVLRNITGFSSGKAGDFLRVVGGDDTRKCHVTKCIFDHIERVWEFTNTVKVEQRVQNNHFYDISAVSACMGQVLTVDAGYGHGDTTHDNVFDYVISDENMLGVKLGACKNTKVTNLTSSRQFVVERDAVNWDITWTDGSRRSG